MAQLVATPSLDGDVGMLFQLTWAAARDSSVGTDVDKTGTTASVRGEEPAADTFHVSRMFMVFDMSSIPGTATITSATLGLNIPSISAGSDDAKSIDLVSATPASDSDLVAADFDQRGSTKLATELVAATGANTFTLNAAGLAHLTSSLGTNVRFAVIVKRDLDNTDPPVEDGRMAISTVEDGTAGNRPTLTINYSTVDTGGFMFISS